ncbi:hypothetical protein ON010_g5740 [Phytophthora cinnamomi]|nr:hypothetical protein ON010_g5740 [Phytophthora cinnamomi]
MKRASPPGHTQAAATTPVPTAKKRAQHVQSKTNSSIVFAETMLSKDPFVAELKTLFQEGDNCGKAMNKGEFCEIVLKATVLIFRGARSDVTGYRRTRKLPMSTSHVRVELKLDKDTSMVAFILDTAQAVIDEGGEGPIDQNPWILLEASYGKCDGARISTRDVATSKEKALLVSKT